MTANGRQPVRGGAWLAWSLCAVPRAVLVLAQWPGVNLGTSSVTIENGVLSSDIGAPLWPPLYAAFAETLWRLVGGHVLAYVLGHVAVASMVGVAVLSLCRSLALPHRTQWLAVLATALLPYYLATATRQLDVAILIAVCAAAVAVTVRWRVMPTRRAWMPLAVALAAMLLFLTRANALSLIVLGWAALLTWPGRIPRRDVVAAGAIVVALLTGWSAVNAQRFGRFTPFPANVGLNMWVGNHPGAGAAMMARDFNPSNAPGTPTQDDDPYDGDRQLRQAAIAQMAAEPAIAVANVARRFYRYFDWRLDAQFERSRVEGWAYTAPYLTMLLLASVGVGALWRRQREAVLVLGVVVVGYLLPHLVTFGMIRFRMTVEWAMLILAAAGADVLAHAAVRAYSLRRDE